jgi:hypothetical protein
MAPLFLLNGDMDTDGGDLLLGDGAGGDGGDADRSAPERKRSLNSR